MHTSFPQFSCFMLWYNIKKMLLCNDPQCCLSQQQNKKHRSQTDAANLASDATQAVIKVWSSTGGARSKLLPSCQGGACSLVVPEEPPAVCCA